MGGQLPPLVYFLKDRGGNVQRLAVAPEEYMVTGGMLAAGRCFPAVVQIGEMGSRPMMILGEVFMRHYFTVFHWGSRENHGASVGFAPARSDSESEAFFLEVAAGKAKGLSGGADEPRAEDGAA